MKIKSKFFWFARYIFIVAVLLATGCATVNESLFSFDEHYKERLHVKERNNLKIEVAALSSKESESHFGYALNREVITQSIYTYGLGDIQKNLSRLLI
ncbi:MAG TPA: hypothetical protein VLM20_05965 [Methylophilaceae bacterium]|nr:hypothetical protein [Methylophilaceae bacterium]